jgi:hypothetical protein
MSMGVSRGLPSEMSRRQASPATRLPAQRSSLQPRHKVLNGLSSSLVYSALLATGLNAGMDVHVHAMDSLWLEQSSLCT